ncbi:MAG: hypothetical protein KKH67_09835 [candidate division Zixibacteria bacterium]|nr:hypothetical protein [candidate division Zixibacteria bacterium]MBU1470421.1 hypothetical protein [candidate division Zixibacteria bacterium]
MIRRVNTILIVLIICGSPVSGAFRHPATSPATAASAETLAGVQSAGVLSENPAAFALLAPLSIEFSGQRLYDISELDSYVAAVSFRPGKWGVGISFQSMGESDFYLESTIAASLGYSPATNLHGGLAIELNRIDIAEPYGSLSSFSSCAGLIFSPSGDWFVYADIRNPTESRISGGTNHRREFSAGVSVHGVDNVGFAFEVCAVRGADVRYKIGEEYRLTSRFSASAGIMTSPFVPSFGFRFGLGDFDLLYTYRYHPELGGTHAWGIAYSR